MWSSIGNLRIRLDSPALSARPVTLENSESQLGYTPTVKVIDMCGGLSDSDREKRSLKMTTDGVVAALPASCSLMDGFERRGVTQPYAIGGAHVDFLPSLHHSDVS